MNDSDCGNGDDYDADILYQKDTFTNKFTDYFTVGTNTVLHNGNGEKSCLV